MTLPASRATRMSINKDSPIYVAGHRGMVGSAVVAALERHGYHNLLVRSHPELDLTEQAPVREFFHAYRPAAVILAAARVGGIAANSSHPALFIRDNLLIQGNVIDAAQRSGVEKLVFLGSSCIYPRLAPQPIREEYLLTGPLEPTNEWYAVAKIAGIKLCQALRREFGFNAVCAMPTNLYGPGDNFDLESSHVLPALIRRFHDAKLRGDDRVVAWGSGAPRREFLHVADLADALVLLLERYDDEAIINVGCGEDITIRELCEIVMGVTGYGGRLEFDATRADGVPRKLLDVSRMTALGWQPRIPLRAGLEQLYAWYIANSRSARRGA
jgi:GDP-L-fucose synthase